MPGMFKKLGKKPTRTRRRAYRPNMKKTSSTAKSGIRPARRGRRRRAIRGMRMAMAKKNKKT